MTKASRYEILERLQLPSCLWLAQTKQLSAKCEFSLDTQVLHQLRRLLESHQNSCMQRREKEPLTGFKLKNTNSAVSEIRLHASQLANRCRYHALQFSESATFYDYVGYISRLYKTHLRAASAFY
jgi:hypothetical protein